MIKRIYNECREKLLLLFHPIAPHITEETWELMGKKGFFSLVSRPTYEHSLLNIENEFK